MIGDIKLDKPLVFFDLEATGTSVQRDRIVEISVLKVFPDGTRKINTRRVNPEMHIPESASQIHGIYDADVADAPTFRDIAIKLPIVINPITITPTITEGNIEPPSTPRSASGALHIIDDKATIISATHNTPPFTAPTNIKYCRATCEGV